MTPLEKTFVVALFLLLSALLFAFFMPHVILELSAFVRHWSGHKPSVDLSDKNVFMAIWIAIDGGLSMSLAAGFLLFIRFLYRPLSRRPLSHRLKGPRI
jgi:hypothetical protein